MNEQEPKNSQEINESMDYKKLHEKTLTALQQMVFEGKITEEAARSICADFVNESEEGEKIRNELILYIGSKDIDLSTHNRWISWLEKLGEQKSEINDNILLRFAFYQYDDDTLYLSSVFVEECNRKHGYGIKILKAAEGVAKTFGVPKIRLKVERNTWMEEWYKKNGYEYLSPDGEYDWLEKRVEQKPADKVEPKFKVGDWVVQKGVGTFRIIEVCKTWYEVVDYAETHYSIAFSLESDCRLWTIQDAKDGDILATGNDNICIFDDTVEEGIYPFAYCGLTRHRGFEVYDRKLPFTHDNNVCPATKEQRDLLFSKMKEAGYEWDSEKKELRKISQGYPLTPDECIKSTWSEEDKNNLYLTTVAIEREYSGELFLDPQKVNEQVGTGRKLINWLRSFENRVQPQPKQEWSEEDENIIEDIIEAIDTQYAVSDYNDMVSWLKSLKDRVQPQPKQEWSEEEKARIDKIIDVIDWAEEKGRIRYSDWEDYVGYVKSLRPQNAWKPNDEQLNALYNAAMYVQDSLFPYLKEILMKLYEQLKKLKEE